MRGSVVFVPFMTRYAKWHFILFLAALFTCTKTKNDKHCDLPSLVDKIQFTIHLDSLAPNRWGMAKYINRSNNKLLYILNTVNNSVDIYDLDVGMLSSRVSVPTEGDGGISQLQGFTLTESGKLIVFDRARLDNALLVDRNGNSTNIIENPGIFRQREGRINHVSVSLAPTYYQDSVLYIAQWPLIDLNNWELVMDFPWLLRFDISSQGLKKINPPYPNKFNSGIYWGVEGFMFSRVITSEGDLVCSWGISDSILVTTTDGRAKSFAALPCDNYSRFEGFSVPKYVPDYSKEYIDHLYYSMILYDPFKDIFHRVAMLPNVDNGYKQLTEKAFAAKRVLIISLDRSFNKIAETKLPGGKFDIYGSFITERGLCIPENNILNETIQEDEIRVHVFEFDDSYNTFN